MFRDFIVNVANAGRGVSVGFLSFGRVTDLRMVKAPWRSKRL